jgi:hypothetical protein
MVTRSLKRLHKLIGHNSLAGAYDGSKNIVVEVSIRKQIEFDCVDRPISVNQSQSAKK